MFLLWDEADEAIVIYPINMHPSLNHLYFRYKGKFLNLPFVYIQALKTLLGFDALNLGAMLLYQTGCLSLTHSWM